jgi:hypothetical protein
MSGWRREGCRITASPDLNTLFPASSNCRCKHGGSVAEVAPTRPKSFCRRMLANSFCRDSESADSSDKGYFRSFRTMHFNRMLREGASPEVVRDMGHANIA